MENKKVKKQNPWVTVLIIWGVTGLLAYGQFIMQRNNVWIIGVIPISERVLFWIFLVLSVIVPGYELIDLKKKQQVG